MHDPQRTGWAAWLAGTLGPRRGLAAIVAELKRRR